MNLAINKTAHAIMLAHCQEIYPSEACGFLGGQDGLVTVVSFVENALNSPVAYEMDPLQQLEAMLDMENNGLDLMAAYHSHPHGPSRPSPTDLAQAYYPDLPQIIISLRVRSEPSVRAFLLAPNTYQELKLQIV
jgi:[CysO sulfur-carrier protein]-S-L-cysteine hydrolase